MREPPKRSFNSADVNGLWTAGSYDLTTIILREEWGFKGVAMTDWWADINRRGEKPDKRDFAAMAAAQNDLYMVCADGEKNDYCVISPKEKNWKSLSRGESFIIIVYTIGMICFAVLVWVSMQSD